MPDRVVLLSIPGLRTQDLAHMPTLARMAAAGDQTCLVPSFPAVTCPVQANMTTGKTPREHGVIANGFFYRDKNQVEMWTAWNECIERPQIWDILHEHDPSITSAVWFPLHSKGCGADYICTPAPIHNPDGSETLWCYTKPTEMYGTLRDTLGHFPLQHFWGPLSNIKSTGWICDSAVWAVRQHQPRLFYIYLPHLDYAAQKWGPDSEQAIRALTELDGVLTRLVDGINAAYDDRPPLWLVASEYTIVPVDHVTYPNRMLRQAGLLSVVNDADSREQLDFAGSSAWALVDHQFSHVFVNDPADVASVVKLFSDQPYIDLGNGTRLVEGYPLFGRWSRPISGWTEPSGGGRMGYRNFVVADSAVYMGMQAPDFEMPFRTALTLFHGLLSVNAQFNYKAGLTQYNLGGQDLLGNIYENPNSTYAQQAYALAAACFVPVSYSNGGKPCTDYGFIQTVNSLRFNSMSIGYNVPRVYLKRLPISSLSLSLQGRNLGVWTNYRGKDPDVNGTLVGDATSDSGQLPMPRSLSLQLRIGT